MKVEIKKKLNKKEVGTLLRKIKKTPKLFDAKKYFGKAKVKGDPLLIQQEMRDE